ncbi:MAG: phenylacetate--CoA ligase family protein [Promethearchaeia archaeon]
MVKLLRKTLYQLGYLALLKTDYPNFLKEYYYIKKNMFKRRNIVETLQKERLYEIIKYSIENIPYYKKLARKQSIKISKENIFRDIKKFPILTKEIIRKNLPDLINKNSMFNYRINTSGGTTGEPIKIFQDSNFIAKAEAANLAFNEFSGYRLGDKIVMLWGDEREILSHFGSTLTSLKNRVIKNTIFLNTFKMSREDISRYLDIIRREKPKVIIAYVQSIYELANLVKKYNLKRFSVEAIITTAGVLEKNAKIMIEKIFHSKVFNRYGSREVGIIGSSCEYSAKLHLNDFQKYVEILDDENEVLGENEKGHIIITCFTNFMMPLIRYKIGDIGSLNYSRCACGRNLLRLNNVHGRVVDIFKNEAGDLVDGEYFTHLFYFRDNVKKFQLIQEDINEINIKIETINGKPLKEEIESDIEEKIRVVMGDNCNVNFEYVDYIEPDPSGKFRFTISRV